MAACTPFNHVFLGRPLFLLSRGIQSIINFGILSSGILVSQPKRKNNFSNIIEILVTWAGHVARMGEERVMYRVLVGKPEGKRPLGRPRRRCVDNIRMDLQDVGCGYMDWIGLAQDRDRWRTLVSAVMNLRVP